MTPSSTVRRSTDHRRRTGLGRAATVGASVAVAATLLTSGSPAQADTTTEVHAAAALPVGVPTVKSLGLSTPVRDVLVTGNRVWVSTENEVDVYSTAGAKLKTITGLLGAQDLIAAPDGKAVYVAASQGARIATLSPTALTETASWPTEVCPSSLALVAGRLFYSFGCDVSHGALGSVSLSDGSAGPIKSDDYFYSAPQIGGGGTTLVAMARGGSPVTAYSYTVDADGNLVSKANAWVTDADFAVSPDGSQVVYAGDGIRRYTTADFSVAGTFATGNWTRSVAYAPDGRHFAGMTEGQGTELVRVFSNSSGAVSSHSDVSTDPNPRPTPRTLTFSANSASVYGITTPTDGTDTASLVTATAQSVSRGRKPAATVTSPKKYGQKATVRVTSAPAKSKVTVNITAYGTTTHVSKVSSAKGTVTIPVTVRNNGKITVTAAGGLRRAAATSSARSFKVPAKLGFRLTGAYGTSGGVQHFHQSADVRAWIVVSPNRGLSAEYQLQGRVGGKWITALDATYTTSGSNTDYLYVKEGRPGVRFRFVGRFAGDSYNSKAPKAYSKTFVID